MQHTSLRIRGSIAEQALDQLFREARTHRAWLPDPVPIELVRVAYELARLGPTSANCSPGRFVVLTTSEAEARLRPALAPGNVEQTMSAPVTVIIAWDTEFYDKLPRLFPPLDMRSYFAENQALIDETVFRNGSLQGGYFILAARALGLDCGPMSGFDHAKDNAEFLRTANGRSIFCVTWVTETRARFIHVFLAWSSRRPPWSCRRPSGAIVSGWGRRTRPEKT